MSVIRPHAKAAVALVGTLSLTACAGSDAATEELPTWHNSQVNAVSRTTIAAGVAATASADPDGSLRTVTLDLDTGRKLWSAPATMAGRLPGMGVSAPATVPTGTGKAVVAAVEPLDKKPEAKSRWKASLVARDARTGRRLWSRPVHSTFGPQRCGFYVCVSEHTALSSARVVVLDPVTGQRKWRIPGIAEVEWFDAERVVMLRLAADPALEAYELKSGKPLWQRPLSDALGEKVDLSGGWAFGATHRDLVGYVAPYTNPRTGEVSAFGLLSVRLADGTVNWMRPSVVRVYPSGSPGYAPVVRPVDERGQYGGFARLDPETGRVLGQVGVADVPGSGWWLAFPSRMDRVGFLKHGKAGTVYDLASGRQIRSGERVGWSFCVTDPKPLTLSDIVPGFYSVAALCEYDLTTGTRTTGQKAPPTWFTGGQEGWRVWRDEKGGLHAVKDGTSGIPGMYG